MLKGVIGVGKGVTEHLPTGYACGALLGARQNLARRRDRVECPFKTGGLLCFPPVGALTASTTPRLRMGHFSSAYAAATHIQARARGQVSRRDVVSRGEGAVARSLSKPHRNGSTPQPAPDIAAAAAAAEEQQRTGAAKSIQGKHRLHSKDKKEAEEKRRVQEQQQRGDASSTQGKARGPSNERLRAEIAKERLRAEEVHAADERLR